MNLISAREFEKRLEYCFVNFTIEDYKAYILYMAQKVSTSERADFLTGLEEILNKKDAGDTAKPGKNVLNAAKILSPGEHAAGLLEQIDALKEAFDELVSRYENGDYDYDDYSNGYYNDEPNFEEMSGYDDLREKGNSILLDARDLFTEGHYKEARAVYAKMEQFLETGYGSYGLFGLYETEAGIKYNEEMSKFLRCIYLTEQMENRPMAMYAFFDRSTYICEYINIKTVIQCSKEEMPDLNYFLMLWKNYLLGQPVTQNTSYLIREAAEMHGGIDEIKELALNYGDIYQEAYLDWVMMLRNKNEDITDTCLYALDRVTEVKTGLKICSYLAEQAEKNGDGQNCMAAWEKAFCYERALPHLLNMLKYARILQCQEDKLRQALKQIKNTDHSDKTVEIHILIFLGDYEKAYEICREGKALGWSYGSSHIPVLAGFFMKLLSAGKKGMSKHIDNFWNAYTGAFNNHPEYNRYIVETIEAAKITEQEKDAYYQWCIKICCDRIDGIVSGKHRNAYDRAAQTLAACEELRSNICGKYTGESLVTHYLDKYPRHSSFRGSVKKILG